MILRKVIFHSGHDFLLVLALLFSLTAFSCSRPRSEEHYVRSNDVDALGRYNFMIDADSSGCYDIDVLIFMSISRRRFVPFSDTLSLEFQAPSGKSDFIRIPIRHARSDLASQPVQEDFFNRTYQYTLQYEIPEPGDWGVNLSLPSGFDKKYGINGIGLEVSRHGTR